jgi:hypothetical protein
MHQRFERPITEVGSLVQSAADGVIDYQKLVYYLLRLSEPMKALGTTRPMPMQTRLVRTRDERMRQEPMPSNAAPYVPTPPVTIPKPPRGMYP